MIGGNADNSGVAAANPFRLERCPTCDYSLAGLPDAGVCPECGEAYDRETVELTGEPLGVHVTVANGTREELRKRVSAGTIVTTLLTVYLLYSILDVPGSILSPLAVLLLTAGPGTFLLLRRFSGDRASVRLRMNAAGIVQDDDADEPEPFRTLRIVFPRLILVILAAAIPYGLAVGQWWISIFAAVLAVVQLPHWLARWSDRQALRRFRDAERLAPVARRAIVGPRPWAHVQKFGVEILDDRPGFCRVFAMTRKTFARDATTVADIVVPCSPEQAVALRAIIHGWWKPQQPPKG